MADKQGKKKAADQIVLSLAMIASLKSNIEHYFPDIADDPEALTGICNRLAEEIGELREVFNLMCRTRYQALLPDSGVTFDKPGELPEPGPGITK